MGSSGADLQVPFLLQQDDEDRQGEFLVLTNSKNRTDTEAQIRFLDDEEGDFEVEFEPGEFPRLFARPSCGVVTFVVVVTVSLVLCCTVFQDQVVSRLGLTVQEFLKYASIPLVMIPFTYAHIWLALYMTFFPVHFRGCNQIPGTNMGFPLGWQGIVPFKAEKMAKMAVNMLTTKLLTVEEVIQRLDPETFATILQPAMALEMQQVIHLMGVEEFPAVWNMLPMAIRQRVVDAAQSNAKTAVVDMVTEIQQRVDDVLDLEDLVVTQLTKDMELGNDVFIQCSHRELHFIRNAGAWMGGFFGLVQMILWRMYPHEWVLPAIGFVVGAITNWIALFCIFNPVNPIYITKSVSIQGLFLKRQKEVSCSYGHMVGTRVLTGTNLVDALTKGPKSQCMHDMTTCHVGVAFDDALSVLKPLIEKSMGEPEYQRIKGRFTSLVNMALHDILMSGKDYMEEACDLERTLRVRMSKLPPKDFEGLLHPIFQEEEWKLVLMGGVLGVLIALVQVYGLF